MKIRNVIKDNLNEIKTIRRKLHMNPEIGFNTHNTMNTIIDLIGIEPIINDGISGVFYLPSKGKCIAFRCELDALNIIELNQHEYKSKNEYMHACGHDMHMAIIISLIRYYLKHDHYYSLAFIFQPAEESGAGALHMIQQDLFKLINIHELYAFHVLPKLGDFIGCKDGLIMAQSCEIDMEIKGISGHLNSHQTIDSIKYMNIFLNKWYELNKELKPNIIHIGKINCGQLRNSVCNICVLEGTIRCINIDIHYIKETINNILRDIDIKYNTISKVNYSIGYPALINSPNLVNKIIKHSGDDYIHVDSMILSDDFSYYKDYCEICYIFCGLTTNIDLHTSNFDLKEEDCLKMLELLIRIIEDVSLY